MSRLNYNKSRLTNKIRTQRQDAKLKAKYKKMAAQKATPAQIALMNKLDIEIPSKCSKIQASNLISYKLNLK